MNELVSEVNLVFPCPIWTSLIENYQEVNERMEKYIKTHKDMDTEGKKVSNIEGWHSKNFNLKDEEAVFIINSISYKIMSIEKEIEDIKRELKSKADFHFH